MLLSVNMERTIPCGMSQKQMQCVRLSVQKREIMKCVTLQGVCNVVAFVAFVADTNDCNQ